MLRNAYLRDLPQLGEPVPQFSDQLFDVLGREGIRGDGLIFSLLPSKMPSLRCSELNDGGCGSTSVVHQAHAHVLVVPSLVRFPAKRGAFVTC